MSKANNMEEYIAGFPKEVRERLQQIRETVKNTVPDAEEAISYGMPAFNLNGRYLVYFGAYKKHIGMYPVPSGHKAFEEAFPGYATSGKGTIRFPLDRPLPLDLVEKIVRFRVSESLREATSGKPRNTNTK